MANTPTSLSVSIVIPNWNGVNLLKKNLPTVIKAAHGAEIVITDDHSDDGSVEWLREAYPKITLVTSNTQTGFSGNVNRGVRRAEGDIIILLNTDVRPDEEFIPPLLSLFRDPQIAAVGCLEQSHEGEHIVTRGRGVAHWVKGYYIHARGEVNQTDTAWVSGGSAAYRKSVWSEINGMDTIYNPFYWEDIDLSYQIQKAGFEIRFEPKSIVHHYHEQGKIKTAFSASDIQKVVYRNQFIFHWKNISDIDILVAHIFWTPIRLAQALLHGDINMSVGYIMAFIKLPKIIQSRMHASKLWRRKDSEILQQ